VTITSDSEVERGDTRSETHLEQLDRNLGELTGELRVVVTGVQVLFAFLLIAPFDAGFARLDSFERGLYFVTLVLAALAAACTIAPAAAHRVLFRHHEKALLVGSANRASIAGLAFLAAAMCGSLMLISDILFGLAASIAVATAAAIVFASLWLVVPLSRGAVNESRERRSEVWPSRGAGSGERVAVEIDWANADVRDGTLAVALSARPSKEWAGRFKGVLALLEPGRSEWGNVSLRSGTIRVDHVAEGDERDIRHFLESLVAQANAGEESAHDNERELSPQEARDRRLAEGFRAFSDQPARR
jgi:hypothetical protein